VADEGSVGPEPGAPEFLAQHDDPGLAGLVRRGVEGTAEERRRAQERKEVRGRFHRQDSLRVSGALEIAASHLVGRELLEAAVLVGPIPKVRDGDGTLKPGARFVDADKAVRLGERKGAQQDGVQDAEEGRVGSDAQGEAKEGHRREPWRAEQGA
jgi:hypothetical protein